MGVAVRVVIDHGHAACSVPGQVDDAEHASSDADLIAVLEQYISRYPDAWGIETVGQGARAGLPGHVGEGQPVIAMPVCREDLTEPVRYQAEQRPGLIGRIDEELFAAV